MKFLIPMSLFLLVTSVASAQNRPYPKAKVDFDDFAHLVAEVGPYRANRRVDLDGFLKMSREPGTIVLDTRSTFRFERIHLAGAKHLSFTDFTQDNLASVIPSFETRILIYCNNNFEGDQTDFATKIALPTRRAGNRLSQQFDAQAKPLMMALNIPTFISLYGYGYRNIYELDELVNVSDPRISFEGSAAEQKKSQRIAR